MNPLFFGPATKAHDDSDLSRDDRMVQDWIHPLPSDSLALRLGRLLIRMGSKLAHEDTLHDPSKDALS